MPPKTGVRGSESGNDSKVVDYDPTANPEDEASDEAVEWTRKTLRQYFRENPSNTYTKEAVAEYLEMIAEITGKTQMAKEAKEGTR